MMNTSAGRSFRRREPCSMADGMFSRCDRTPSDTRRHRRRGGCYLEQSVNNSGFANYSRTAGFLLLFLCRSEAFASRPPTPFVVRGGETAARSSTAAFVTSQRPPTPFFSPPEEEAHFQLKKKNGVLKPTGVEFVAETKLPTDVGQFLLRAYRTKDGKGDLEPCVIYSQSKPPQSGKAVPIRIHDQCITSEVFRSQRWVTLWRFGCNLLFSRSFL